MSFLFSRILVSPLFEMRGGVLFLFLFLSLLWGVSGERGERVFFFGDSIVRNLFWVVSGLVNHTFPTPKFSHDSVDLYFDPHRCPFSSLHFRWVGKSEEVEGVMSHERKEVKSEDWVIISFGLWDILHTHDPLFFADNFDKFVRWRERKGRGGLGKTIVRTITPVLPWALKTEEKRKYMTNEAISEYNQIIRRTQAKRIMPNITLYDANHLYGNSMSLSTDGVHAEYPVVVDDATRTFLFLLGETSEYATKYIKHKPSRPQKILIQKLMK